VELQHQQQLQEDQREVSALLSYIPASLISGGPQRPLANASGGAVEPRLANEGFATGVMKLKAAGLLDVLKGTAIL
jgi:hypothetical protein